MDYSLDDAKDKLRWAIHHFEILRPEIEAFEKRDNHSFSVNLDRDEGAYTFHVHGLEPVDPDWGLVLGDCIHNARTALDYLMVQLFARATQQDPRETTGVLFPISSEPGNFRSLPGVVEARKVQSLSGYLARIEELQTYNILNPSVWQLFNADGKWSPPYPIADPLAQLQQLDIVDKHRVVHAVWAGVSVIKGLASPDPWPSGFAHVASSITAEPLIDGAEIGCWLFETPLPSDWEPSQVDMKSRFPIEVAFDKQAISKPVLVMLPLCLWAVAEVLRLFEPVFATGAPPLPVTVIQPPPGRLF
jgi:hypothetical protein